MSLSPQQASETPCSPGPGQATAVPVTHRGWPGPGLFQLTGYFQRFGNRWHLVSWLWGLETWIPDGQMLPEGFLNELGDAEETPNSGKNQTSGQ